MLSLSTILKTLVAHMWISFQMIIIFVWCKKSQDYNWTTWTYLFWNLAKMWTVQRSLEKIMWFLSLIYSLQSDIIVFIEIFWSSFLKGHSCCKLRMVPCLLRAFDVKPSLSWMPLVGVLEVKSRKVMNALIYVMPSTSDISYLLHDANHTRVTLFHQS